MNETHDSGSPPESGGSVLRPFTAPETPPLPPIEPSRVVPAPPVMTEPPPPPPPADDVATDPWSPDADQASAADDDFWSDDPVAPITDAPDISDLADPDDGGDSDGPSDPDSEVSDDADQAAVADGEADAGELLDETLDGEADDDDELEPTVAGVLPAAGPPAETITLPRKTFLIGLGVLLGAVALFAALWQASGGDEGDVAVEASPDGELVADGSTIPDADDPGDTDTTDTTDSTDTTVDDGVEGGDGAAATDDGLADELAEARAEIASLEASVESLQDRPPPALDGTRLRRIVVGSDAKALGALPGSVAVVGTFGGVSLIDPETNQVVANGNVAPSATRVLRTSTSVWLTNYSDNQLIRVDPTTNTVAATFPFPGPDGIEKDGDTLVVASFDGEFVARVNPSDGSTIASVNVGGSPTDVLSHPDHGLWVAVFDTGELVQIDPATFQIINRVIVGQGPVGISADGTHIWAVNHNEGTVAKMVPSTGEVVLTVAVGDGPTDVAAIGGEVWVTVTDEGQLVQFDASDGTIRTRTPLGGASTGGGPTGLAQTEGTLWVAMQGEQSVVRVELG